MVSIDEKKTRGKTRPGRLRYVDTWLRWRIEQGWGPDDVVDLGPGEHAWTTLELTRALPSTASIYAVDNDPVRCENLRHEARGRFSVIEGGFDLGGVGPVDLIRAMNVFRQYPIEQALPGYRLLASHLRAGGQLLVGSCDSGGDIGSFWVYGSDADPAALVVWTSGADGFAPIQFRDWLPRDIRRADPGESPFLELEPVWRAAWERVRAEVESPQAAFDASIEALGDGATLVAPGLAQFRWGDGGALLA